MQTITIEDVHVLLKPIASNAHKGSLGHALIIGGSYGKIGSVCLSTKAALKSGCGLVTAYIPECGYPIMQTYLPEAMVLTDNDHRNISKLSIRGNYDAVGIGPGMGTETQTISAFKTWLETTSIPMVIDADAINILSQNKQWLELLRAGTILTPHPKELERLIGKWSSESEKIERTADLANRFKIIIVSKGAPTTIFTPKGIFTNTSGNAALATAGSGDVLTGIITSLLAQGYSPNDSAIIGVFIHGLTADLALPETGTQSFIASDIIANLGRAFIKVQNAV